MSDTGELSIVDQPKSSAPATAGGVISTDVASNYQWVEAWGMTVRSLARVLRPTNADEIRAAFEVARRDGVPLGLRGGGNSYGDASVNAEGHTLDIRGMNRVLDFEPETGRIELEPGVTIEELWKFLVPHGYWPKVVSGTMFPAIAGALAMNIHGKNNYKVGTIGDNCVEFDLVLPNGELKTCNREQNADLFHAAIGGFGMLGCFSRAVLNTKRIHSGDLWVTGISTHNLREMMDYFEAHTATSDYLVGWIDAFSPEPGLGRGLIHDATYLEPGEDPDPEKTLTVAHQTLPPSIFGVPKSEVWRALRVMTNNPGVRFVNAVKYLMGRLEGMKGPYKQSQAGFSFLLDYVPNWKWMYGRRPGRDAMIQYQVFLPDAVAHDTYCEILERCQAKGFVTYLGVFKRHRPDPFLMTHALDGWSMAMDFRVTPKVRTALYDHLFELADLIVARGGRFYFAKDSLVRPADAKGFFPTENRERFLELKRELDPDRLLQTNLARRVFPELF